MLKKVTVAGQKEQASLIRDTMRIKTKDGSNGLEPIQQIRKHTGIHKQINKGSYKTFTKLGYLRSFEILLSYKGAKNSVYGEDTTLIK